MAGDGGGGGGEGGDTGEGGGEGGGGLGVGEGEGGGGEGGGIGGGEGGGGGGVWALCAEDRRTGEYFPRSRALSSRICDGTVLRTMSSMLSTPTASSMAAWSLSRGPRWRAANLSLAARVAAADDICRGAPILPISARIAGWAKPRPSCELRILSATRCAGACAETYAREGGGALVTPPTTTARRARPGTSRAVISTVGSMSNRAASLGAVILPTGAARLRQKLRRQV